MPALDLPRLAVGARVQHELLVAERSDKKTAGGDPFIVLTLMNSTGRIDRRPSGATSSTGPTGPTPGAWCR